MAQDADEEDEEVDYTQLEVDSILSLITPNTPDSTKARLYFEIGDISDNVDTVLRYSLLSLDLCKETDIELLAYNCYYIGWAYYYQGKSREALYYYFKSTPFFEKLNKMKKIGHNYIAIAKCYHELNIKDSIFYYFDKGLAIFQEIQDSANIAYVYESLGNVNSDFGYTAEAVKYYQKSIYLDSLSKYFNKVADTYRYMGRALNTVNDYNTAELYLKKSIFILDTIADLDSYSRMVKYVAMNDLAEMFMDMAEDDGNTQYADSCLAYIQKIGNYFLNIGREDLHFEKMELYSKYLTFVGKHKEALEVLLDAKQYMGEDENDVLNNEYYGKLYEAYENIGDYKNALECYKKQDEYKKNYTNDSTLNVIANFKTEQEMKIHKAEAEAKQSRMRMTIFSLIGGLGLVSLLVFYIVRVLNIKRKANRELTDKNQQLDQQKSEILAQRDEITAQKEIITQQWQEVEEVNQKLVSSINYAQRIQTAAISLQSEVDALFPENFVYYKPRDIVSGDYYRVASCGKYRVLITADCTGHGIPGAFLSMLGISALKEYCVTEDDAANPGIILDHMREFIKATLISGTEKTIDDGMDMTICSYDFAAMEMRYAAANQSAYIIRRGEAIRLKGDRMPVGRYVLDNKHFATHIQPIEHGDMIYTFSDGIQDQPGGKLDNELGKKFLPKNLVKLLTEIAPKPLAEQRDIIDNTITQWRNGRPQVDDITMIGIRV